MNHLSAKKLSEAISKASDARSRITDEMIAAGRGYERHNETMTKDDGLSLRYIAASNRCADLRGEEKRRMEWHGSLKPIRQALSA